jgi:hypothetical protein
MAGGASNIRSSITRHKKWAGIVVVATLAAIRAVAGGKGVDARKRLKDQDDDNANHHPIKQHTFIPQAILCFSEPSRPFGRRLGRLHHRRF